MADNTTQTGTDTISTDDVTTLNGAGSSGVKVQRVKNGYGDDGTYRDVSTSFPLPVKSICTTGTVTSVAASATVVTLLASNANRVGASFYNDSSAILYLACASGASTTAHTVQISAGGFFEVPFGYTGIVTGVWASATGSARVTEFV